MNLSTDNKEAKAIIVRLLRGICSIEGVEYAYNWHNDGRGEATE